MVDPGAATPRQQPEDGWWKVSEQLDLLRAVVVQLVTLVTETTVAGHSALTSPGRNDQESGVDVLAGTSASAMAAIRRGEEDAQLDAAITVGPGEAQTEPAILRTKRDTQDPAPTARNEERGTEHSEERRCCATSVELETMSAGRLDGAEALTYLLSLWPAGALRARMSEPSSDSDHDSGAHSSTDGYLSTPTGESRHIRHPAHIAISYI
ncbi:unnamed protein product [Lampetra planeri]